MSELKVLKKNFSTIKTKLKEIALLAGKGDSSTGFEKIHSISIELIMDIIYAENKLSKELNMSAKSSKTPASKPKPKLGRPKKKKAFKSIDFSLNNPDVIENEIQKIGRRLPTWVHSQQQINAQILTKYLQLREKSDSDFVYESDLAAEFPELKKYKLNFNTMKSISRNNSGKLFNVIAKKIYIWEPVKHIVETYKSKVLDE